MSAIEGGEQRVNTGFGTVTDRQVIYHANKGWFSGGSREDIPLRHVTSVRVETSRRPIWGIILLLIGLVMLLSGEAGVMLVAIVLLALAVLLLWGSPKVVLNTAGGDLRPSTGFPWTKDEAERFAGALRNQLFKDEKQDRTSTSS
jgi:hypothetical protein